MVNEQKVRMMTKIVIYEEGRGKKAIPVGDYYRGDYIGKQMIKSFFLGTLAFIILAVLWVCYGFESLVSNFISLDIQHILLVAIVSYGVFMGFYLFITYVVSAWTYKKGIKSRKVYEKALKRLENMYE